MTTAIVSNVIYPGAVCHGQAETAVSQITQSPHEAKSARNRPPLAWPVQLAYAKEVDMKQSTLFWTLFCLLTLAGCDVNPAPLAQAVDTAVPTPTAIPTTASTEATATSAPEAETAVPTPSLPVATASDDGKVYLGDKVLLDIEAEGIPCFLDIPAKIIYSPSSDYFLVIPACLEGDNELYLFRADGTDKQRITGAWDVLNFNNVTWANEQSFIYERINSCCLIPPADAPPVGQVQYDLLTGEKTLIATPTPRP